MMDEMRKKLEKNYRRFERFFFVQGQIKFCDYFFLKKKYYCLFYDLIV